MVRYASKTDTGVARRFNEDDFLLDPQGGLFVVTDGMGGSQAGDVAAKMCAQGCVAFVQQTRAGVTGPLPFPVDNRFPPEANRLAMSVRVANQQVFQLSQSDPKYRGMGCTVAAILVEDYVVNMVHVGDSRIYRWSAGRLELLTRDHSKLNRLIDKGRAPKEGPHDPRDKKALHLAVGVDPDVQPTLRMERRTAGDLYMLCTDGLTDMVSDRKLAEYFAEVDDQAQRAGTKRDLDGLCRALIAQANERGGEDNITVVFVEMP